MTFRKTEPPPIDVAADDFPDLQDLLPLLLGQTDVAPNGDDVETYLAMMDKKFDNVPDADKRELIHFLVSLCESVIGIQFGVDPVQLALARQQETSPHEAHSMVNSKPDPNTVFKHAATAPKTAHGKG